MTADHRKYVLIETAISVVFNTIFSIIFAFVAAQGADRLPLWGPTGMAVDLVPTVFMITLVTTVVVTLLTYKRLAAGKAPALERGQGGPLAWAPRNAFARGVIYGALFAAVLVPLSIGALLALGVESLPFSAFLPFKAVYGAVYAALVTPLIVRAALAAPAPRAARTA
jgi:hypothetical protein